MKSKLIEQTIKNDEIRAKLNEMVNGKFGDQFGCLWSRWQDEREYEDFADYVENVKKNLPMEAEFVKMTRRPFAVTFLLDGRRCEISVTSRTMKWRTW